MNSIVSLQKSKSTIGLHEKYWQFSANDVRGQNEKKYIQVSGEILAALLENTIGNDEPYSGPLASFDLHNVFSFKPHQSCASAY